MSLLDAEILRQMKNKCEQEREREREWKKSMLRNELWFIANEIYL